MRNGKMVFDPNDARLTAFALGELEGEERAEIEALIAEDAEARAFVEGVRETAKELEQELALEPAPALSNEQRERIEAGMRARREEPHGTAVGLSQRRRLLQRPVALATAAFLVLALGFGGWIVSRVNQRASDFDELTFGYEIFGSDSGAEARISAPENAPGSNFSFEGQGGPGGTFGWIAQPGQELIFNADGSAIVGELPDGMDVPGLRTEAYDHVDPNPFRLTSLDALSTFSIDVDTASYANVRRFLIRENRLPPPSAVRVEEFINYFRYSDPAPTDGQPFAVTTEVASAPWAPTHRLVRIGLRAKEIPAAERPASNLVFLIDVSGSMDSPDKLPLLVSSMKLLVEQLDERDRVALVVYAGASGLVLPPTSCADAWVVMDALDRLQAGGSTNGGEGIQLAYATAGEHFVQGGLNRVILCTDGDFNVGVTDEGSLVDLIEEQRKSGVFLSVLGFGTGNLNDSTMEKLADKGNGNYAYIDDLAEARKVLVAEMGGTLLPVAKDVKIQVELNPTQVQAWRLIGYENRILAHEDFADDTKDAGEIGAGLAVTALYEIVPHGVALPASVAGASIDPSRYQQPSQVASQAFSGETLFLKLRYKPIGSEESLLIEAPVRDGGRNWYEASNDFKLAAGAAAFAMKLRGDPFVEDTPFDVVRRLVSESMGDDAQGYWHELLRLISTAGGLSSQDPQLLKKLGYTDER
jgi:Ca-activated chloride channel homolog